MPDQTSPSFDEFPYPTYEEWRESAEESLKGVPFEKLTSRTYEGITLQPLYRQEDTEHIAHQHTTPGAYPYVRGVDPTGHTTAPWLIAQEIAYSTPEAFNAALRYDLERGQTAVNLLLDEPTRAGLDPDQSEPGTVGRGGVSIATADNFARALDGVDLKQYPLFIRAGTVALPLVALLGAMVRQTGKTTADLTGCIENDPLGVIAHQGSLPLSLERAYDEMAQVTAWAAQHAPQLDTIAVHSYPYHNAGASAAHELAFALATGVAYLRAMSERGINIDTTAGQMRFMFAIGSNFFMEVAKLRAARMAWAQVIEAFGGSVAPMTLHARTGTLNKTVYDPYVNMLRTTVEALAGAVGGAASMHVAPFDEIIRPPDAFSRRIARNQQIILQHEANLTRLIDPAGGSWYVEHLTDWLAKEAWTLFQQIEAEGGMFAALQSGFVGAKCAETADARLTNVARRRDRIVGTNMYANSSEQRIAGDATDYEAIYNERAAAIRQHRTHDEDSSAHTSTLEKLAGMLEAAPEVLVEATIEAAEAGATLNEIARTLRLNDPGGPTIDPVCLLRVAEPFEALRDRAMAYRERTGARPRIFLANMGPVSQHKARADFTAGFFEVGGFEIIYPSGFDTPEAAAQAALESRADAVVICSTDPTYPEIVPPLVSALKAAQPDLPCILAGYPQDQLDAHKAAGIDEFIHIRANCLEVNQWLQDRIGAVES